MASAAEPAADAAWVTHPFNGKDLEGWEPAGSKLPNRWEVGKAELDPENPRRIVVKPGGSELVNVVTGAVQGADLVSKARWGDCRIELEVMVPERSNSGVYVMGKHEVQILDGINSPTSGKGSMGAIYGIQGPLYFPAEWRDRDWRDKELAAWLKTAEYRQAVSKVLKQPGEWQTLKIEFRLEKQDPATKTTKPATFVRVELNGALIHENVELQKGARNPGPLMLQGNHGPVAYRNIKITPLQGEK